MSLKCPGQDSRYWTPDDINEKECPGCGYMVEFIKTDLVRNCPECGRKVVNPRFNMGCAEWCEAAEQCLGASATLYGNTETIREAVKKEIDRELAGEQEKIVHINKIAEIAEKLGSKEKLNLLIVILAALLHAFNEDGLCNRDFCEKVLEENEIPPEVREVVLETVGFNDEETKNIFADILHDSHLLLAGIKDESKYRSKVGCEFARENPV